MKLLVAKERSSRKEGLIWGTKFLSVKVKKALTIFSQAETKETAENLIFQTRKTSHDGETIKELLSC